MSLLCDGDGHVDVSVCVLWGKIVSFLDGQPSDGASVGKHWPCYKVAAGSTIAVIVDW